METTVTQSAVEQVKAHPHSHSSHSQLHSQRTEVEEDASQPLQKVGLQRNSLYTDAGKLALASSPAVATCTAEDVAVVHALMLCDHFQLANAFGS